jgi:hypothetical protein
LTVLKRGSFGDEVKGLQRNLHKLSSLLVVNGDSGPTTETAVADGRVALGKLGPPEADDAFQAAVAAVQHPSQELTAPGVSFIGREEVAGPQEYRRTYSRPIWPTKRSGITVGIGYDLSAASKGKLAADWSDSLNQDALHRLALLVGVTGTEKRLESVADIEVPLHAAVSVFLKRMIPDHVNRTRTAYPRLDDLSAPRLTALISLVFNRGNDLNGDRRRADEGDPGPARSGQPRSGRRPSGRDGTALGSSEGRGRNQTPPQGGDALALRIRGAATRMTNVHGGLDYMSLGRKGS